MDVSVNKIDALNAVLTVKISNEDYKTSYESSLKNHRKQMQLPGFRKGHVPTSVIKKKYGPSILAEEIDKILNKSIYDYITENKLNILGNPLPIEDEKLKIDWSQPSDFEFKYELGLAPEILPDLPGRLKYTKYQPKINEALIDKQVDDFARRYGKLTSVEKAGERDMIMANFKELDQSGNVVVEGFNQSSTVSLEFITDKKSKRKLTGCKPTDTFQLDPKKISRGEADMAAMLGIDKEKAKHYMNDVLMTVNEVKTLEPANIDVVLFDKIYGAGEAKNEEDFLKKWILSSNKEAKKEDIEKEYDRYAEGLKWQLIENFIIKDQELKVDGEELLNFTMELMGNQYVQYGMMIPEEDELKKTAQKVLSNNDEARKINDMIYDKKVMGYLKNTLKINDKFIAHEDFTKKVAELTQ